MPTSTITTLLAPFIPPRPIPHRLEMYQAEKGDLLRIKTPKECVIFDSGTPGCATTLLDLLSTPRNRCRLLIVTHLDQDHYGGLRSLVQSSFNRKLKDGLRYPETVWLNDFEPRNTLSSLLDGLEEDGPARDTLNDAIAAAKEWRERHPLVFVDAETDTGAEDPRLHIEMDHEAFQYLLDVLDQPQKRLPSDFEYSLSLVLDLLQSGLDLRPAEDELRTRARETLRRVNAMIDRRDPILRRNINKLELGNTVIAVSDKLGIRVHARDRALLERVRAGDLQDEPREVAGILHLSRDGTVLLEDMLNDDDTLSLADALRSLGIRVESAIAGRRAQPLHSDLELQVIGPGRTELNELRARWREIREKARVHVKRRMFAFLEASLFMAVADRYALDRSVTNRSSIQVLASTSSGWAVLTGDGRPDTLAEGLKAARVPATRCSVFKAAHHGGAHNIMLGEDPNAVFEKLEPLQIWISGKGDHPAGAFVDYIRRQQKRYGFSVAATNLNDALRAMPDVRVLRQNPIRTSL